MHLHIDCSFGASGDMLLAALADAGADIPAVRQILEQLPLGHFLIESAKVFRGGVAALNLKVGDLSQKKERSPGSGHDHGRDHERGHEHGHEHRDGKGCGGPHRHLADLLRLLDPAILPKRACIRAERVFRIMAEAEAAVHSQPVERVHFHEISGVDTAVDVIGVCVAMEMLDADSVSASIPAAGSGMIMCEHGIFPVPAPATLEILKSHDIPWRQGGDGERMTPTGAALLAGLVDAFGTAPEITVIRIGYGAGNRDYADSPNLLRVIIGKPTSAGSPAGAGTEPAGPEMPLVKELLFPPAGKERPDGAKAVPDRVVEFRFVVDDMTPEAVAYLQEACLAAGAVEAYSVAAAMKKGRLGHELTVLSPNSRAAEVAEAIWRNSLTFGLRLRESSRLTLARELRTVKVEGQPVRIKIGWLGNEIIRRQPEYEDCRAAALATGKPLADIFRLAERTAADLE